MDSADNTTEWRERTGPVCEECGRLCDQARAALLSGDMSRLTDVRVMRGRHCQTEHGQAA